jgi:hypothetical protein
MRVAGKSNEGKLKGITVQQAAEELDSVIQTINQVTFWRLSEPDRGYIPFCVRGGGMPHVAKCVHIKSDTAYHEQS